jgi:hypothetical protein
MDRLQSNNTLVGAYPCWHSCRVWHAYHLYAAHKLHHRCVSCCVSHTLLVPISHPTTMLMFVLLFHSAASALAASLLLRSTISAALPLLSPVLFNYMGVQWVFTLLGSVVLTLVPIPFSYTQRIDNANKCKQIQCKFSTIPRFVFPNHSSGGEHGGGRQGFHIATGGWLT